LLREISTSKDKAIAKNYAGMVIQLEERKKRMEKFNIGFDLDNNDVFEEKVDENERNEFSSSAILLAGGSLENTQGVTTTGTTSTNFTLSTLSSGDLGEGILSDRQFDSLTSSITSTSTGLDGAAHLLFQM
jgi:hypothetical protein